SVPRIWPCSLWRDWDGPTSVSLRVCCLRSTCHWGQSDQQLLRGEQRAKSESMIFEQASTQANQTNAGSRALIVPGDGIFTTWSYRAGAARAEAFLLTPQPLAARTAHAWGVVAEVVPNGKALSRARELAELYLKAPEVTRRNTRVHFMQPLKERIVREVGYGLSLEGASAADL